MLFSKPRPAGLTTKSTVTEIFNAFSNVPATFYGFASAFAFLLLSPRALSMEAMTATDLRNVLICVPVSLLIGSVLGVVHQTFASLLTAPEQRSLAPLATRLTPLKKDS